MASLLIRPATRPTGSPAPDITTLARLDAIGRELARCTSLSDLKRLSDQAAAVRAYAQAQRLGETLQAQAIAIVLRADRRRGELLRAMPKNPGRRGSGNPGLPLRLADLGLSKIDASRAQRLARVRNAKKGA